MNKQQTNSIRSHIYLSCKIVFLRLEFLLYPKLEIMYYYILVWCLYYNLYSHAIRFKTILWISNIRRCRNVPPLRKQAVAWSVRTLRARNRAQRNWTWRVSLPALQTKTTMELLKQSSLITHWVWLAAWYAQPVICVWADAICKLPRRVRSTLVAFNNTLLM